MPPLLSAPSTAMPRSSLPLLSPRAHPLRMTTATSPLSRVPAHCEWLPPPHLSTVCPPTANDCRHITSLPRARPLWMTTATSPLSRVPAHCEWLPPPHLSPVCPPTANDCCHITSLPRARPLWMTAATSPLSRVPAHCEWLPPLRLFLYYSLFVYVLCSTVLIIV